jgi:hypothetical protein
LILLGVEKVMVRFLMSRISSTNKHYKYIHTTLDQLIELLIFLVQILCTRTPRSLSCLLTSSNTKDWHASMFFVILHVMAVQANA